MNKEIEELLNKAKDIAKYGADGKQHTRMFNQFEAKALLSYIEQIENNRDKAIEKINDYKIYCEKNKGLTEYTDIEIEAIEPVISKLEDILKEVSE